MSSSPPLRAWIDRADRLLAKAARRSRVLGSLTPINALDERHRLVAALRGGNAIGPRWSYALPADHDELRATLTRAAEKIEADDASPLSAIYAARARELALEAHLATCAGSSEIGALADLRFASRDENAAREASALARAWILEVTHPPAHLKSTDGVGPDSLVSRMRAEIGRLALPFSVTLQSSLASLAATGDRVIFVAEGRQVSDEDIARTVLHEVHGHARPRARAIELFPQIFAIGTARGADDQEGYALLLEERNALLGPRRKRVLAARHLAVEAMRGGASFADTTRMLTKDYAYDADEAVVVAERAFRGGDGVRAGLGRERVYLDSLVRVRAAFAAHPEKEATLSAGQVSLDAIDALAPYVRKTSADRM